MPAAPPTLEVQDLGKRYRLGRIGARESLARVLGRSRVADPANHHWALRNVSFTLNRGDVLGVVGANGAGKSTLLKLMSRVTRPTEGRAVIRGRVGSLLEVGTGFHPELTGMENVFINGAILGMSRKEIRARLADILEFAGIGRYIDTPVKRYSSGMYTRLAFAIAAHLEPEVLIVDEVLAVGDAAFQKRCLAKMHDAAESGRTILFVSHGAANVRKLCSKALLLERGEPVLFGGVEDVLERYEAPADDDGHAAPAEVPLPEAPSDLPATGLALRFMNLGGELAQRFALGEAFLAEADIELRAGLQGCVVALGIVGIDGTAVCTCWSEPQDLPAGVYRAAFRVELPLKATRLRFAVGVSDQQSTCYYAPDLGHVEIGPANVSHAPALLNPTAASGLVISPHAGTVTPLTGAPPRTASAAEAAR